MKKSQKQILGIDISKASFHVALLDGSGKEKTAVFKNNSPGFRQLNEWLELNKVGLLHACMEATSRYYEALAEFLYEKGHHVSVVNPQRIKGFAQSELRRSKTDRIDASLIARFCEKHNPRSWSPLPSEIRELQEVERYLHSLKVIRLQEQNKLESRLTSKTVMTSIERHISEIDKQIKELEAWMNKHTREHSRLSEQRTLITSVIGIGDLTSYTWLGELGYMDSFNDANQLESFCGLNLRKKQSGTSITGREKLSKVGNRFLRKALYMPALTAMAYNPAIKKFADRLKAKGKPSKVVIGAVMRKLLRIIFVILKSGRPFDVNFVQGT